MDVDLKSTAMHRGTQIGGRGKQIGGRVRDSP